MEPLRFKIKKHRNNFTNRMIGIVLLIALLCSLLSGCSSETKKVSKEGFYFDTIITITLYGTDDEKYINDCFSLAKEYENKFSNTIKDSEISQINDADGNFVTVSDDTLELIQDGINYGKESDGKFDIAIGTHSLICGTFPRLQKIQTLPTTKWILLFSRPMTISGML